METAKIADTLLELKEFQTKRLRETYADFSAQPEFAALVEFFFSQIYGTQDFGFRNESIKTLHQRLSGLLHGQIIDGIGKVIELNDLTENLDRRMAEEFIRRDVSKLSNIEIYGDVYRSLDNYDQRVHQINLMVEATKSIHHLSQMWLIGLSLKAVSKAAHIAGYGKIMDFLEAGYSAFHRVKNIRAFLDAVQSREMALNDRLFGKTG